MTTAEGDGDARSITGINVTPLVDVTLVLLIVFLVTAKTIVSQGIPVQVPQGATPTAVQSTLVVTIEPSGAMSVDGRPIADANALLREALAAKARDREVKAVIRASSSASHGHVVTAMDALRQADVTKIAFAVEKK